MSIRTDGKEAHTFVKLDIALGSYSLLDVSIKTGRTHQIRVHLSSKKLPIIGDKTYNPSSNVAKGTSKSLINIIRDFSRQALHSHHLSFEDMDTNKIVSYEASISDDMQNLITNLEKHI